MTGSYEQFDALSAKPTKIWQIRPLNLRHTACISQSAEVSALNLSTTDSITELLEKFLDVQSRRARTVAGNIANADTPGYKAKELKFDDFLREAVEQAALPASRRQTPNFSASSLRVVEQDAAAVGPDGNTVDTGKEMADLAHIGTNFNFGAKILQSRLRLLRTAIREGR